MISTSPTKTPVWARAIERDQISGYPGSHYKRRPRAVQELPLTATVGLGEPGASDVIGDSR